MSQDTYSPTDWMPNHKPNELWRIKLKTWNQQPVPMMSEHSAHLTSPPFGFRTWLWRHTCLLLISMLWHRQLRVSIPDMRTCRDAYRDRKLAVSFEVSFVKLSGMRPIEQPLRASARVISNTKRSRQNDHRFENRHFRMHFLGWKLSYWIKIYLRLSQRPNFFTNETVFLNDYADEDMQQLFKCNWLAFHLRDIAWACYLAPLADEAE